MKIINKVNLLFVFSLVVSVLIVSSCKKKKKTEDAFVNPYDDPSLKPPAKVSNLDDIDPSNFAYLHAKIFKPTCANSGCHDGTFPPDYRTITSTYNTLVYQKPVNTKNGAFRYRVYPFNSDSSILYHRMTVVMGSGTMPLYAQDDWNAVKDENLLAIKNWINAGAKDMFGNYPKKGNKQPIITGFLAFPSGNTSSPYSRGGGNISAINIPANSSIDLWFLVSDDSTALQNITGDTCLISKSMFNFTAATNSIITYSASSLTGNDFTGNSSQFKHKATISTTGLLSGSYLYIRAHIRDGSQGSSTEIPNAGSSDNMLGYFALKIQ